MFDWSRTGWTILGIVIGIVVRHYAIRAPFHIRVTIDDQRKGKTMSNPEPEPQPEPEPEPEGDDT
jgi:hypothetical protein